jgi:hypothetical protein
VLFNPLFSLDSILDLGKLRLTVIFSLKVCVYVEKGEGGGGGSLQDELPAILLIECDQTTGKLILPRERCAE